MDFLNIYKGKKVLVTGHTGFKGAWLSIWLKMIGADVIGFSLDPEYKNGIYETSKISEKIIDYRGNICDLNELKKIFKKEQPEVVFHLAAQALVIKSYNDPVSTFEANVMGTVNVLEAIKQTSSVKAAIMITTDKCYENKETLKGYTEDAPMGGHDPYSASKGAAELIISSYRRSFFSGEDDCRIASARAGNVIGGGDWSDNRLVPDIVRSIINNKNIELRNPGSIRPWQHVLEPLSGYLKLGSELFQNKKDFSEGWNFGPYVNEVYPVHILVEKMIDNFKKGKWIDISEPGQLHEANLLMLDINKAIQKLKWKPVLSFDQCVNLTAEWYKTAAHENVLELTRSQIKFYEEQWNLKNAN
jgi:CDP-glucose 4,6-dehydratase